MFSRNLNRPQWHLLRFLIPSLHIDADRTLLLCPASLPPLKPALGRSKECQLRVGYLDLVLFARAKLFCARYLRGEQGCCA